MTKIKILVCMLFLPCCLTAQSKSFKKTYKAWEKGKTPPRAAQTAFEAFSQHKKHGVAACFYAVKLQVNHISTLAQLLSENDRLLHAEDQWKQYTPKRQRRIHQRYHVNADSVQALRALVQWKTVAKVRSIGTFSALDTLEQHLQSPFPALQPAIDSAISDVVQAHLTTRDYEEATLILKKYATRVKPMHYRLTRQLHQQTWELFQDKYPLCQLDRYARDYPKSFVARDCWRDTVQALICSGSASRMLDFLSSTPWTALENVLMREMLNNPPEPALLNPQQQQYLEDIRQYTALTEAFRQKNTLRDTTAALLQINQYVARYAPRFSAWRLLETGLQYFLEKRLYHSATAMLTAAQPYFPDTLPKYCTTNFDFQRRVKPAIQGKLPLLARPGENLKRAPVTALNTPQGDESNPVLSPDGQTLYFCGAGRPDNPTAGQDVFVSHFIGGQWDAPQAVRGLSGPNEEVPLAVTADQRQMLLTVNGRLHLSTRTDSVWNTPTPLSFPGLGMTGKGFLSADGNIMILEGSYSAPGMFNMPDQDLFVAFREGPDAWTKPFALGSDINTDEQEANPFLSTDGQTLFFTSDGWPGFGKSDVFFARRTGDKWTQWSRPYNLGKELNDTLPHAGFGSVLNAGKMAYYTLRASGNGTGDIWMFF